MKTLPFFLVAIKCKNEITGARFKQGSSVMSYSRKYGIIKCFHIQWNLSNPNSSGPEEKFGLERFPD
jgi:hypothetical protein